jgi:hypothetical protein
MTVRPIPFSVPPNISASNNSRAAQASVLSSIPSNMTSRALPVGLISLSNNNPKDKEGYKASSDNSRLKFSIGNQYAVIKALWL